MNIKPNNALICLTIGLSIVISGCANTAGSYSGSRPESTFVTSSAAATEESTRRSEAMYQILVGEFIGRSGDYKSAADHYATASTLVNDLEVAEHAAKVALYARDYEAAERAVNRWVALDPGSAEASELAAVVALNKGDVNKAFTMLSSVIDNNPEEPAYQTVEKVIYSGKEVESQLSLAKMIRLKYIDSVIAQRIYARLAFRNSQLPQALAATEKALSLDPSDERTLRLQSQILLAAGQSDIALDKMRGMVTQSPDDVELRLEYARMLVQAKEYERALSEYNLILQQQPEDASVIYTAAILEYELGNQQNAIAYFTKLSSTESHANEANYYLGRLFEEQPDQAINYFSAVNGGEYYLESQVRVADLLARMGKRDQARAHLTRIRNSQNNDALKVRLYMAETRLLREQERYQDALTVFDEALESYPQNIDLLYSRAMTGQQAGDLYILERDLKQVIEQEPDNAMALNALGYTLADQTDRFDEAHELIEKALSLSPEDPAILDSMGWVLYRKGDLAGAEKYLSRAFTKMTDAEVAGHLATVLIEMGNQGQARETLRKALIDDPENTVLLELQKKINQN